MITIVGASADLRMLGFIPAFLNENDPRPAREQFDERYRAGGGWRPTKGHTLKNGVLKYPGDPPQKYFAVILFRDEQILFFPHAFVAILQRDGSFEVARMD